MEMGAGISGDVGQGTIRSGGNFRLFSALMAETKAGFKTFRILIELPRAFWPGINMVVAGMRIAFVAANFGMASEISHQAFRSAFHDKIDRLTSQMV